MTAEVRRLRAQIAELERKRVADQALITEIAARRDSESTRAEGYRAALTALIGGLDLLANGAHQSGDDVGKAYHERTIAALVRR